MIPGVLPPLSAHILPACAWRINQKECESANFLCHERQDKVCYYYVGDNSLTRGVNNEKIRE